MTTKVKVKQLEKKYNRIIKKIKENPMVIRNFSFCSHRLVDKDGYLLNKNEIKQVQEDNEKVKNKNGLVVYLTTYFKPREK